MLANRDRYRLGRRQRSDHREHPRALQANRSGPEAVEADSVAHRTGSLPVSRNPIYLGMVLASFGLGIAIDELWVSAFALFALVVVHLVAVVPEERYLAEVFGEEYARYRDRVRRYL